MVSTFSINHLHYMRLIDFDVDDALNQLHLFHEPNNFKFLQINEHFSPIEINTNNLLTFNVRSNLPDDIEKQYRTISSPAQYIYSPRGDSVAQINAPPSRLPDENDFTIYK